MRYLNKGIFFLLLEILLAALLSSVFISSSLSYVQSLSFYREETNHRILQDDTLAVYLWPTVESLEVAAVPLTSGGEFRVYFAVNEENRSIVQTQIGTEGTYNLTVNFRTSESWNYMVGVYTSNPVFYREYGNTSYTSYGDFVTFYVHTVEGSEGESTLIFILNVQSLNSDSLFNFQLPESVNAILFAIVTFLLGYVNAYYLYDTYFKNKKEGISKQRWVLLAVLTIVSIVLIYEAYVYTTFYLPTVSNSIG